MAEKRVQRAKAEVRQDRQREAEVWQGREAAGRAARHGAEPQQAQGAISLENDARPKAAAQQRQHTES